MQDNKVSVADVGLTHEAIRAAGGIVHKDGNIFFTNITMLNSAIEQHVFLPPVAAPVSQHNVKEPGFSDSLADRVFNLPCLWKGDHALESAVILGHTMACEQAYDLVMAHEQTRMAGAARVGVATQPEISGTPQAERAAVPEGFMLVPTDINSVVSMGWTYLDAAREASPLKEWAFSPAGFLAAINAAPVALEGEPTAPAILEAISWHASERDDLMLEQAVEAFRHGYKTVRQRDDRATLLQLIHLMASAPAAGVLPTPSKEGEQRARPMNGIPATMRHDEGAIAQCAYCRRYSLDPATLSDRQPACECGKKHGWSGSFKRPGPDAKWSGKAPTTQPTPSDSASVDTPELREILHDLCALWIGDNSEPKARLIAHIESLVTAAAAGVRKDAEAKLADTIRGRKMNAMVVHNMTVANQAAWIEWRHGGGAEAAMEWIENGLIGPGLIPGEGDDDENDPNLTNAQAYFDAHYSNGDEAHSPARGSKEGGAA